MTILHLLRLRACAAVILAAGMAGCLADSGRDGAETPPETFRATPAETPAPATMSPEHDDPTDGPPVATSGARPAATGPMGCWQLSDLPAECPWSAGSSSTGESALRMFPGAYGGPIPLVDGAAIFRGATPGDAMRVCDNRECFVQRAVLHIEQAGLEVSVDSALPPAELGFLTADSEVVIDTANGITLRDGEGRVLVALTAFDPARPPALAGLTFELTTDSACPVEHDESYGSQCHFVYSVRDLRATGGVGGPIDLGVGQSADVETADGRFRVTHHGNAVRLNDCISCAVLIQPSGSFSIARLPPAGV